MLRNRLFLTTKQLLLKSSGINPVINASFSVKKNVIRASNPETLSSSKKINSSSTIKKKNQVELSIEELNHGYRILHGHIQELLKQAAMFAVVSPVLAVSWLALTNQILLESPVALSVLGFGGALVSNRIMQMMRVKNYVELSVKSNPDISSLINEKNQQISQIIARYDTQVKFNHVGLQVLGSISDKSISEQVNPSKLSTMSRVVLPTCTLTNEANKLVNLSYDRWLVRLTMPFSILNLILILSKDPEDKKADDYIIMASSTYNLFDYFDGPTVAEARAKLTKALKKYKTPEEVIRFFVDRKLLDAGGMNFLLEWAQKQQAIGVRVDRAGNAILYKNSTSSFGGPFPLTLFAKSTKAKMSDLEYEKIMNEKENSSIKSNRMCG